MTDISLEEVKIAPDGRSAEGSVEYDRAQYKEDSAALQGLVKDHLKKLHGFTAAEVKVYKVNDCRDGFRATGA